MSRISLSSWLLVVSLALPGLAAAWDDTAIEAELAATQTYLSVVDVAPDRVAGALIKLPDLPGDELMKIDYKPNGRESSLFRFYWLRNGELELFREYDWVPRGGPADFERKTERSIRFESGVPVVPSGRVLPADADAIRQEGEWLYSLVKKGKSG